VVNAEIEILKEMGVEIKCGVEVGKDVTLAELRKQGYQAFYIAIGAQATRKLNIEGEAAEGVLPGVDFVRDINLGKEIKLSGKVIVIGGGNVAIDVARTAVREGAEKLALYCLESRKEMPALPMRSPKLRLKVLRSTWLGTQTHSHPERPGHWCGIQKVRFRLRCQRPIQPRL
jgi:NADPH-dependent glutamate synthase beta subunit-like oxidoreductase